MTKHTPGPWRYALGDEKNPHNGHVRDAHGGLIVLRATMNPQDEGTLRLIAAAPQLLAALKHILPMAMGLFPEGGAYNAAIEEARDAVAAAKGEA